jgi:hypothetical protein
MKKLKPFKSINLQLKLFLVEILLNKVQKSH